MLPLAANVASASDVESVIDRAVQQFGRVDVLVNSVGIGKVNGPVALSESDWDNVAAVNIKGPLFACKNAIPQMVRQGGGSIVPPPSVAASRSAAIGLIASPRNN